MINGKIKHAVIVIAIIAISFLAYFSIIFYKQQYNNKRKNIITVLTNKDQSAQTTSNDNKNAYYNEITKEYPAANRLDNIIKKREIQDGDMDIIYEDVLKTELRDIYVGKYVVLNDRNCKFNVFVNDRNKGYEMTNMGLSDEDCEELRYLSATLLNSKGKMIAVNETGFMKVNYKSIIIRRDKTSKTYRYDGDYAISNIMNMCNNRFSDTCKTNMLIYTIFEKLNCTGCSLDYNNKDYYKEFSNTSRNRSMR